MHSVDRYRVVLLTVVLAFFGSFCAYAANSTPFSDSFDDYANGASLNGNNGWLAVSTVVATNSEASTGVFAIGTNSCYIPAGEVATNETQAAVSSNVWVDFYAQVQLMGVGAADPTPADGVVAQFFFNSSGYPVVLNGTTTNWVTLTTTLGGDSVTAVATGDWVRVSVFMNYTDEIWSLFVDDSLIKDDISFHTSDTQFDKFVIENETYLDDLWVNTNRPDGTTTNSAPILTSDSDGDGMGDSFELDYWGDANALGGADADDDGRSNAEEFSASPQSNPLVADSTSRSLPFRDAFESSSVGVKSSGWHGMTNSGIIEVVSGGIEGSKALSLSNGLMSVSLDDTDGTNVWIQIYTKPVIAQNDSEPAMSTNDVACFYIASGGVLRAWSEGDYTNLMTGIPADTWLAFAVHLDYSVSNWNLYVATNGVYGDNMVRANDTAMLFNTNATSATSLTNIIIELAAETNMLIDVLAASYGGNTNLLSTHTNLVAYDRLVGQLSDAGAPPYDYGTANTVTNSLNGALGVDLMWGMEENDEVRVFTTNGWNLYTLDSGPSWQNDGNGLAASAMYVDKGTGMTMKKAAGRDQVVFYPYGELITVSSNIVVAGTNNVAVYGWNYLTSPFNETRTFNDASLGIGFTNSASAGDRIYLRNEEYIFNGANKTWMDGRNATSVQLAPGETFWYFNKSAADILWTVTGL